MKYVRWGNADYRTIRDCAVTKARNYETTDAIFIDAPQSIYHSGLIVTRNHLNWASIRWVQRLVHLTDLKNTYQ